MKKDTEHNKELRKALGLSQKDVVCSEKVSKNIHRKIEAGLKDLFPLSDQKRKLFVYDILRDH